MDILVPIPMKNAAKCDTQCELQNASHQIFERKWRRLAAGMWCSVCFGNHTRGMWLKGGAKAQRPSPIKRAQGLWPSVGKGNKICLSVRRAPRLLPGSSH